MAIDVLILFDNPDPGDCPTTFQENIDLLNELVSGSIVANITPYIRQTATPTVDQQNLVWHKIDVDGRPIGTFVFYSGAWRREYSGRQDEIRYFMGDPGVHFESNGRGIVGGEWDGFALCNGSNGTPNLTDKFIVGAKMDDLGAGYPTGGPWKSTVSGSAEQSGGVNEITLDNDNTYRPTSAGLTVGLHTATGNAPGSGGPLYGSNLTYPLALIAADAGNTDPDEIPTLPPYYALAITKWVGYI